MTRLEGISFGETLEIKSWPDPVIEALGHDPRSSYAETFWLPVLGPSTTWLLRHFAAHFDLAPDGYCIDVTETARSLGLGERSGRNGPFLRSIARAIDFEMATPRGPGQLAVRRSLPPLARRHILRLPGTLRAQHEQLIDASATEALKTRGRRLALSLVKLGETITDTERQLVAWRFPRPLASECARWASAQVTPRATSSSSTR